jgi:hypothetical protein
MSGELDCTELIGLSVFSSKNLKASLHLNMKNPSGMLETQDTPQYSAHFAPASVSRLVIAVPRLMGWLIWNVQSCAPPMSP